MNSTGGHTSQTEDSTEFQYELTNCAKRILKILEPAVRKDPGPSALQVWGEIFGLDSVEVQQDPHEIVGRVRMLRDEVVLLRRLMSETQFSTRLFEPALSAVASALSVSNLTSPWGNYRQYLLAEHMLALKWCSEAIGSEEGLTHAQLQSLLDSLSELRTSVEEDELPEAVKTFVLHQIDLLEKGIHEYPIRGRRAMADVGRAAVAEAVVVDEHVAAATPIKWRAKLASYWQAGLGAAEGSTKMVKLITGVAEAVPKLVDAVHTAANSVK